MTLVDIRPPTIKAAFMEAASERHNGYSTAGSGGIGARTAHSVSVEIMAFRKYQRDGRPQELDSRG